MPLTAGTRLRKGLKPTKDHIGGAPHVSAHAALTSNAIGPTATPIGVQVRQAIVPLTAIKTFDTRSINEAILERRHKVTPAVATSRP